MSLSDAKVLAVVICVEILPCELGEPLPLVFFADTFDVVPE